MVSRPFFILYTPTYLVHTLKKAKNGFADTNFSQRAFACPLSVWEQSTSCCICCYCFWSAPRRDCLKSAITMCLVCFSVCQLIGYCCCCYLQTKNTTVEVFFLIKIILVCSACWEIFLPLTNDFVLIRSVFLNDFLVFTYVLFGK